MRHRPRQKLGLPEPVPQTVLERQKLGGKPHSIALK
jgi:hypothetical protein